MLLEEHVGALFKIIPHISWFTERKVLIKVDIIIHKYEDITMVKTHTRANLVHRFLLIPPTQVLWLKSFLRRDLDKPFNKTTGKTTTKKSTKRKRESPRKINKLTVVQFILKLEWEVGGCFTRIDPGDLPFYMLLARSVCLHVSIARRCSQMGICTINTIEWDKKICFINKNKCIWQYCGRTRHNTKSVHSVM